MQKLALHPHALTHSRLQVVQKPAHHTRRQHPRQIRIHIQSGHRMPWSLLRSRAKQTQKAALHPTACTRSCAGPGPRKRALNHSTHPACARHAIRKRLHQSHHVAWHVQTSVNVRAAHKAKHRLRRVLLDHQARYRTRTAMQGTRRQNSAKAALPAHLVHHVRLLGGLPARSRHPSGARAHLPRLKAVQHSHWHTAGPGQHVVRNHGCRRLRCHRLGKAGHVLGIALSQHAVRPKASRHIRCRGIAARRCLVTHRLRVHGNGQVQAPIHRSGVHHQAAFVAVARQSPRDASNASLGQLVHAHTHHTCRAEQWPVLQASLGQAAVHLRPVRGVLALRPHAIR